MLGLQVLSIVPAAVTFLCSELYFYNSEIKCYLDKYNLDLFYIMCMSVLDAHAYV